MDTLSWLTVDDLESAVESLLGTPIDHIDGWRSERLARLGYIGSLVPRYVLGPLRMTLPLYTVEAMHPIADKMFGCTVQEMAEIERVHNAWAFGLADEFRQLVATAPTLSSAA